VDDFNNINYKDYVTFNNGVDLSDQTIELGMRYDMSS